MALAWGKIRQSVLLIVITGLAVGTVVVYFFVYVKNKEEYIDKRNFKALSKSAENIRKKVLVYSTKEITKNFLQYNLNYILKNDTSYKNCALINDTLLSHHLKAEIEKDKFSLSLDVFKHLKAEGNVGRVKDAKPSSSKGDVQLKFINDTWNFVFHDQLKTCYSNGKFVECTKKTNVCKQFAAVSSIPIEKFIKPLLHDDIFDDYLLIDANAADSSNNFILYESHPMGVADSVRSLLKSFKNEMQINGINYRVFAFKLPVQNSDWVLVGLQYEESYLNETRNFDRAVLYTIILVALIIILSLPWIKVILISKNEKLNKTDVTLCGISILLGCFLWTIILIRLDYDHLFKNSNPEQSDLEELSDGIEQRFDGEISAAYDELKKADSLTRGLLGKEMKDSRIPETLRAGSTGSSSYQGRLAAFQVITWIDSFGMQQYKWSTEKKPTRKIDVSKRDYFITAHKGGGWLWNNDTLVLESIRSWNNSGNLAVISLQIKKEFLTVIAISSYMKSVIDCVVPSGYKFCIADQQGKVWFHSNSDRNLNENIFEECNIKYDINEILYSRGKEATVIYENRRHDFHIRPMKNFPLFLITMKDLSGEQGSKAYVTEVTFILLLCHLLVVVLTILIIWITWRRSLRRYATPRGSDWLKPDEGKISRYLKIAFLNFVVCLLLLVFTLIDEPTDEIFIFILTTLYLLPVHYLFLNNQTVVDYYKPLNRALLISIFMVIVFFNGVSFRWLGSGWNIILYESFLILIIGSWLLFVAKPKISSSKLQILKTLKLKQIVSQVSLRSSYSLALTSLFVVIAVIPVFEFHRLAFNNERTRYAMMMQYRAAEDIQDTEGKGDSIYLLHDMQLQSVLPAERSLQRLPQQYFRLSKFISPVVDTSGMGFIKRGNNFHAYISDTKWSWLWEKETSDIWFGQLDRKAPVLKLTVRNYHPPHPLGWLCALLGLIYLFIFTRYLITRIFIFDTNRNLVEADIFLITDEYNGIVLQGDKQVDNAFKNHLFIIGLPFSGKQDYVDKLHPPEQNKRIVIDLAGLSDEDWKSFIPNKSEHEKIEAIILDHFEFDFRNAGRNYAKLLLLESLFLQWRKKIVILSTIHPAQFLDQFKNDLENGERWSAIFSHFYNIFYPLQKVRSSRNAIMAQYRIDEDKWKKNQHYYDFIEEECCFGIFLQNLKPTLYSLVDNANSNKLTLEELADKVKSLAYTYYASVWSTCSKDERFLIYDLAEDGVVNNKNASSIIQLIYKGIFTQKRTLTIMNRSFRNFVLTYVTREEVAAMRKETISHGTWSSVKGPILFVFAVGLLFLLYTQRGLANEIMAFLGVLIAAMPVLLRSLASVDLHGKPSHKG